MKENRISFKRIFKREIKLTTYIIAVTTILVLGITYAIFYQVNSNSESQVVKSGDLTFIYSKDGNALANNDISNVINDTRCLQPMTLEDAQSLSSVCSYNFSVQNTSFLKASYVVHLKGNSSSTLNPEHIKVILKQGDGTSYSSVSNYPKTVKDVLDNDGVLISGDLESKSGIAYFNIQLYIDANLVDGNDSPSDVLSYYIEGIGHVFEEQPISTDGVYTITYHLNGGSANNPSEYGESTPSFTLQNPEKENAEFLGWTGSNGETPELEVTIPKGSSGNREYFANYNEIDTFPVVFSIPGTCVFTGSTANVATVSGSSCISYVNPENKTIDYVNDSNYQSTYIDSGIKLYDDEHYTEDYEIYFEVSGYNPSNQEALAGGNTQHTIMNSKSEATSGNPGICFRRSGNNLELKSFGISKSRSYANVYSVRIVRKNQIVYYAFNDEELSVIDSTNTNYTKDNRLTVWFGASANSSYSPFRNSNVTLSNIYIKRGTMSD